MQKGFLIAAAIAGLSAVALGAFGAHGLRNLVSPELIVIWEKGVQYQIYHALALFMCSLYLKKEASTYVRNAAICFILGILCFSGSLYLLATRDLTHFPAVILGPVTPIGGFFFIAGWGLILMQAIQKDEV
ncbi:MAG TPA: DUF423 domain-containing protein [Chitinophagales bacterium]|nr:DUF423 domain-containing protein [Chitinophagales bacterium]